MAMQRRLATADANLRRVLISVGSNCVTMKAWCLTIDVDTHQGPESECMLNRFSKSHGVAR